MKKKKIERFIREEWIIKDDDEIKLKNKKIEETKFKKNNKKEENSDSDKNSNDNSDIEENSNKKKNINKEENIDKEKNVIDDEEFFNLNFENEIKELQNNLNYIFNFLKNNKKNNFILNKIKEIIKEFDVKKKINFKNKEKNILEENKIEENNELIEENNELIEENKIEENNELIEENKIEENNELIEENNNNNDDDDINEDDDDEIINDETINIIENGKEENKKILSDIVLNNFENLNKDKINIDLSISVDLKKIRYYPEIKYKDVKNLNFNYLKYVHNKNNIKYTNKKILFKDFTVGNSIGMLKLNNEIFQVEKENIIKEFTTNRRFIGENINDFNERLNYIVKFFFYILRQKNGVTFYELFDNENIKNFILIQKKNLIFSYDNNTTKRILVQSLKSILVCCGEKNINNYDDSIKILSKFERELKKEEEINLENKKSKKFLTVNEIYLSDENIRLFILDLKNYLENSIKFYYSKKKKVDKKNFFIKYFEHFYVYFTSLTLFQRSQIYVNANLDDINFYKTTEIKKEYVYIINSKNEKVSRKLISKIFPLGEENNMIIYFYLNVVRKFLLSDRKNENSLFVSAFKGKISQKKLNKYFKLVTFHYFNSNNFTLQNFRFLFTSSIFYSDFYSDLEKNLIFTLQNHSLDVIKKYYLVKHIFPSNLDNLRLKYLEEIKNLTINKNNEKIFNNQEILKKLENISKKLVQNKKKKRNRKEDYSYYEKKRKKNNL
jgi:hypothetical protein